MQETPKRNLFLGAGLLFVIGLICLVLVLFWGFRAFFIFIEPDERGVVLSPYESQGFRQEILKPGWNLIRLGEKVQIYDISRRVYTMLSSDAIRAVTLDGKTVFVNVSVTYVVDPEKLLELHMNWQNRYEDGLVRPLSRSITREVISRYNANEIDSQLSDIEHTVFDKLNSQFSENYLILQEFSIISVQADL